MNFTQRVMSGVASVSFVAAGVLGLGAAWASSHGPQGTSSLLSAGGGGGTTGSLGTPTDSAAGRVGPALGATTGTSSEVRQAWRSVSAATLRGSRTPDVVAAVHRSAVKA